MSVVSNTGPLVALAKVDSLPMLQALFGEVEIPPAVYRELLANGGAEAQRLDNVFKEYILVAEIPPMPPNVEGMTRSLGAGEQQAIALALERKALLLIDERSGRSAARRLGVAVTGSAGVLVQAKLAGRISDVLPLLEEMRQAGYYLSRSQSTRVWPIGNPWF